MKDNQKYLTANRDQKSGNFITKLTGLGGERSLNSSEPRVSNLA
jgi:hypothetical protein